MATNQNNQPQNYTPIVIGVLGLVLINKFFGTDKEEKEAKETELKFIDQDPSVNPLAPATYDLKKDAKQRKFVVPTGMKAVGGVTSTQIGSISKQIFNAIGVIYNDKSALQGAFKQIPTRAAVWAIASYYNTTYKRDLLFDLINSSEEQAVLIYKYINKLPVGLLVKK